MAENDNNQNQKTIIKDPKTWILTIVVLLVVVLAGWWWLYPRHASLFTSKVEAYQYPEYISLGSNYVFTIPKSLNVYDRAVPGIQILYAGDLTTKTLDEAYQHGGIAVRPISGLTDHSASAFKKYVNDTYVPDLKKNLATDVSAQFDTNNGSDVAQVTVKKNGQQLRFIYLKNGQHPAEVVAKDETDAVKKVEQTLVDVEASDIKAEVAPISQAISNIALLIKNQKGSNLYKISSADLRSKISEAGLIDALKAAEPYTSQPSQITINGMGYDGKINEFTVVMTFDPPATGDKPASGVLYIDKIDGQWQLKNIKLPSIAEPVKAN
ncbi:MAG TPA: hypothetical protein VNX65_00225 [Patescibacteria group bacterium]|jgi:hypothetical protein|nr:hypothetical protein [Patescibacteria group bacterium]